MAVTIYHNPKCGTSRKVLAMIQEAGIEPEVVEYLKTPPTRDELVALIARMQVGIRDILRRKGTPYDELGLDDPSWSDDRILDAIGEHPILLNRPIVSTDKRAKLCRPPETVLDILPTASSIKSSSG